MLETILARLKQARDLLKVVNTTVPDAMDRGADAMHQVEAAVREYSQYLRRLQLPDGVFAGTDDRVTVASLRAIKDECEELAEKPVAVRSGSDDPQAVGVAGPLAGVIASIIAKLIAELLKSREGVAGKKPARTVKAEADDARPTDGGE
jgi:hypothetical protein